jgi:hypothetical protein
MTWNPQCKSGAMLAQETAKASEKSGLQEVLEIIAASLLGRIELEQ